MSKNVDLICILEHYFDGGDTVGFYDYNTLPKIVKDKIDLAKNELKEKTWFKPRPNYLGSISLDPNEEGLQYLFHNNHPQINPDEKVIYKGFVEFRESY